MNMIYGHSSRRESIRVPVNPLEIILSAVNDHLFLIRAWRCSGRSYQEANPTRLWVDSVSGGKVFV